MTIENEKPGILNPGFELTLRPMRYPSFYEHFITAQKNNWSVQEISFSTDKADLRDKLTEAEKHVVSRIIAFFATGDTIVGNNLVLSLYKHVNSPEARMYYGRQLFEEQLHVQFYMTLLDEYIADAAERAAPEGAGHDQGLAFSDLGGYGRPVRVHQQDHYFRRWREHHPRTPDY